MGDERIVGAGVSPATCAARVGAPRSLWDETYRENSWIADVIREPVALLPRLQRSVERFYPGTGLAVTEYNFGAAHHVSGGLAQADALGIFGRFGVAACWWDLGGDTRYVQAAYRLFLDHDGQGGRFGDLSVRADSTDVEAVSVHAARRSTDDDTLTVLAIHKSFDGSREVDVRIAASGRAVESLEAWRFDGDSPELRAVAEPARLTTGGFTALLPPASATLFVVRLESRTP